ncbi:hypothetical protein A2165_04120 [Candidatus Curtissbacteria bacterium RBG_13_40_7]|uniref:histidine kinase n=1 Tax=Candidatus Curtissbacteria bacterium RBG_13_40_7 TaxID=1797706 RepID=A0A1F5FU26_9BACT|nr:MAG: hypothetical protein A2165_04120 [Candidatus Curtissbacteria bacterium RBG_13_40_7]
MFQKARIKLTTWYLLIIMTISILFSLAIYAAVNRDLHRIERFQRVRQEEREGLVPALEQFRRDRERLGLPPPSIPGGFNTPDPEIIKETRIRLISTLGLVNLGILGLAGLAGYFLAGRTLRPIKEMVDEQNRFIADASHELRTPITSLRSEIEVAQRDKDLTLKNAKNILASNLEEVKNLQTLSDDLIELTRFQKDNSNFVFKNISLKAVIQEACRKAEQLAKKKGIKIQNKIKNFTLQVEKNTFCQLFVILLDNAIKYNPKGTKIILSSEKTDDHVIIKVSDTGSGIKKEEIQHLFDRFYRGDKSRTKLEVAGYGLGLSIAKGIVEKHSGSIEVESEEGKGTTFTVKIPIKHS